VTVQPALVSNWNWNFECWIQGTFVVLYAFD